MNSQINEWVKNGSGNGDVTQLLKDCYDVFTSEYGDSWKYMSNDAQLKKVMLQLEKQLGI